MRLLILDLGMYIIELSEIFLIKLSYSFRKENNICQCIFLGGRTGNIGAIYCHKKKKKKSYRTLVVPREWKSLRCLSELCVSMREGWIKWDRAREEEICPATWKYVLFYERSTPWERSPKMLATRSGLLILWIICHNYNGVIWVGIRYIYIYANINSFRP